MPTPHRSNVARVRFRNSWMGLGVVTNIATVIVRLDDYRFRSPFFQRPFVYVLSVYYVGRARERATIFR